MTRMATAAVLVILDTMWGREGKADPWFPINPDNHSGRRLYRLTGVEHWTIWVTNACPQQTGHARLHGRPDSVWLARNLSALDHRCRHLPLLVCGNVAQATYSRTGYRHDGHVIQMRHPAARSWTKESLENVSAYIQTITLS